jgi:hypothetical protein
VKTAFASILRADRAQGMPVTIPTRVFFFAFAIKSINIQTYRPKVLPIIFCGYEIWYLNSRRKTEVEVDENVPEEDVNA